MLYMCYGVDGENGAARRETARNEHFAYLKAHEDILVLGGATLADDSETRLGSCLIINVLNRAAADAFADDEPLRKAGVFDSYTVVRMRRGQWNPDAAPASAEGA
ncbi:MAG: YciI family protein [Alphaproteobacteria bacterium]